jgi:hypothetical protein
LFLPTALSPHSMFLLLNILPAIITFTDWPLWLLKCWKMSIGPEEQSPWCHVDLAVCTHFSIGCGGHSFTRQWPTCGSDGCWALSVWLTDLSLYSGCIAVMANLGSCIPALHYGLPNHFL